jgi:hypothetical protein
MTRTLHRSSLRTQGPITTGLRDDEKVSATARTTEITRYGSLRSQGRQSWLQAYAFTPLSSPGLTGRSSTPRLLDSNSGFTAYWIPAFAGMTSGGAGMTGSLEETLTPC